MKATLISTTALVLCALPAIPAISTAQVLILEDTLRGSTLGTRHGGDLQPDGYHITGLDNYLYWHIPTVRHGAAELRVRGLRPMEDRPGNDDKVELFHMYDHTIDNADTNYNGYRNNPFKHFIRKTGVLDTRPGRTDALELLWMIGENYVEPDSPVLSWDPNVTYTFREEWGPDGSGNTVIHTYRDGVQIMTMSQPGEWAPAGHSIRIGLASLGTERGSPLDAVFTDVRVWDLSGGTPLPGVDPAPHDALPSGSVRVIGNSLADDNGAFLAQGATYMTALWQAKNNRAQLTSDLTLFRAHGFNYIRILGQVAGDYWSGLEIAPVDCQNEDGTFVPAWTDYEQQLRDLLDIVWAHGMRTEITIFGSGANITGGSTARQTTVDLVLSAIRGREEKVILIEVANEGWQNGFPGSEGLQEMRDFAAYLSGATEVPIAVTSNHGVNSIVETYAGAAADVATWHTSRDLGVDDGWGPVWDIWSLVGAPGVPPVSSNEPVGPGSSVSSETRPIHLVMAAAFAWTAKAPMYVFHSSAGVRHTARFEDMAGLTEFRNIRALLPGDLANWARNDGREASALFTSFAGGQADRWWPEVGSNDGCARNIGARKNELFVSIPIGIRPEGLTLEARQPVSFKVFDPLTAAISGEYALNAGERITLPQGSGAWVITNVEPPNPAHGLRGEYFDESDLTQPVLVRRDSRIDFDWGEGAPIGGMGVDTYSVRWTGFLKPRYSEEYTFTMLSDDGTRVWIDGQSVIDDWTLHGAGAPKTGTARLVADQLHRVVVEYFENTGSASVELSWESASQAAEIIAGDRLLPPRDNDAVFVAQEVPAAMETGKTYSVSITMRNAGAIAWSAAEGHRLGAESPRDNQTFGATRADLAPGELVQPGAEKTFTFDVVAPATPGEYDFQRQMLQENVEWFGQATPIVRIAVTATTTNPPAPDSGVPTTPNPPIDGDGGVTTVDPQQSSMSGGCACSVERASLMRGDAWWFALLSIGLLALRRRRGEHLASRFATRGGVARS